MPKKNYKSVSEYIAGQPAASRDALESVRRTIRRALPAADETVSYKIPAYTVDGATVIYFAGWKAHYSIYPATRGVIAEFGKDMTPYEIKGNTFRFPLDEPIPVKLIERIARFRLKEMRERDKKAASSGKGKAKKH
jgi:uncharacterized protein YdhG (YjbR/CyaY superfamily)